MFLCVDKPRLYPAVYCGHLCGFDHAAQDLCVVSHVEVIASERVISQRTAVCPVGAGWVGTLSVQCCLMGLLDADWGAMGSLTWP